VTAAACSFPADSASVPAARRFVRDTLDELGVSAAWDGAAMLVSELATNAVLHARTTFTVHVLRDHDTVRVSVQDLSLVLPRQRAYGTESTTGRGLRLVSSLALAWGVERHEGGKSVWFDVPAAGDRGTVTEAWDSDLDVEALLAGFDDLPDGSGPVRLRARDAA
jgi:anti-sigma regulatory factor (Ser/Thr protein kinase)